MGLIKIKKHREIEGIFKSITITRDVDHWYVSVITELPNVSTVFPIDSYTSIGIDLGITEFAVTSDAEVITNPKHLYQSEQKLKQLQKSMARKKKGSNNYKKVQTKLAKLHRKIRLQRKDFLHKTSCAIAKANDHVFMEDLAVKNMVKNHKLAKAISDCGWYQFVTYLTYKMAWKGGSVHFIDRFAPPVSYAVNVAIGKQCH